MKITINNLSDRVDKIDIKPRELSLIELECQARYDKIIADAGPLPDHLQGKSTKEIIDIAAQEIRSKFDSIVKQQNINEVK